MLTERQINNVAQCIMKAAKLRESKFLDVVEGVHAAELEGFLDRPNNMHSPCRQHFSDLKVGEHFIWGDKEHVKLPEIGSGPLQFGSTHHFGFVNCIRVGTLQLSGMGPLVEVTRIAEVQQAA